MTDAKVEYIGPGSHATLKGDDQRSLWSRVPRGFLCVVVAPTLLAAIYFFVFSAPRYVSEARFIVRKPDQPQLSGAAIALQGVGLSNAQTDAFAVHEYMSSRDSVRDLKQRLDVEAMLGRREGDIFYRYPRLGEKPSAEGLHKALERFVHVGYDARTGISTLKVEAFRPADALALSSALLDGGEKLVNRLNDRSSRDAVAAAAHAHVEAKANLDEVQGRLTALRNREGFVDPTLIIGESAELIGTMRTQIAQLKAERDQLRREAPGSPMLSNLEGRIAAYEAQVVAERGKIAGSSSSIAPQVAEYQDLVGERELAERQLALATGGLISARQDASRQQMYLERVVNPNRPDVPTEPARWRAVLTVLVSTLLLYFIGWLVWAGVREHRQD